MAEDPKEPEPSSRFSDMLTVLKACWLAMLIIVTVFIVHESITGIEMPFTRATIQVVSIVAAGGAYAYTEGRADLTPWQQRLVIACIGLFAALLALGIMHLIW